MCFDIKSRLAEPKDGNAAFRHLKSLNFVNQLHIHPHSLSAHKSHFTFIESHARGQGKASNETDICVLSQQRTLFFRLRVSILFLLIVAILFNQSKEWF